MARKPKQPVIPTQYKHVRFADSETGEILNFGGFTLAYRFTQQPSEVAGRPTITAEYAYAECSVNDNFDKNQGRKRTYNRLMHAAPDFYEKFDLTPILPEGYEHHIIDLGEGIVDLAHAGLEIDLQRTVIERFLAVFAAILNVGTEEEGPGNLLENLIVTEAGILAINADVLSYMEPAFETVAREVAVAVVNIADEALDTLDSLNLEDPASITPDSLASIRKNLSDIKDLCSTMVAASTEIAEEESDEEDLPTDDDDAEGEGGVDDELDEEESDEDDEDEEGDDEGEEDDDEAEEDEGDDNPR